MEIALSETNYKNIGIISMYRVPNYGSYLQSLGLLKMLQELGCYTELLDYRPEPPITPHSSLYFSLWRLKKVPAIDFAIDKLALFLHRDSFILSYKQEYLPELGVGYVPNYQDVVDVAIIGSDEVFNCLQTGFNVGFSPMLFGEGVRASRIASYAASFGSTTIGALRDYGVAERVASWLSRFAAISVRDSNSKSIVDELLGTNVAQIHLDPVLVSDYELPNLSLDIGPYAVLYTYKHRLYTKDEINQIRNFCTRNRLKLISFGDAKEWVDEKIKASPLEMLAYYSKASFVITDTFHGAVFAIKTNRNFAVLVRDDNRNKLEDMLMRLGQEDRIVKCFGDLQVMYDSPASFDTTNNYLSTERVRSRDYLCRIIQSEACNQ